MNNQINEEIEKSRQSLERAAADVTVAIATINRGLDQVRDGIIDSLKRLDEILKDLREGEE